MLYLNTKYLILTTFEFESPYVVSSVPISPTFAEIASEKQWIDATPDLLWVPAVSLGVLRWLGWIARKSTMVGLTLTKCQRSVLDSLPEEIARQIDVNAKSELALGEQRAANRLPVDPGWIPEIEEAQAIMGTLVRFDGAKPWDGYRAPVYAAPPKGETEKVKDAVTAEKKAKATPKGEVKPRKRVFANQARDAGLGLW